jgi:uncharacterized protein involved in exopolysaccharide biosynthesis
MSNVFTKQNGEMPSEVVFEEASPTAERALLMSQKRWSRVRLLWDRRRFLFRAAILGLMLSALVAFLLPPEYESTAQLMPPEQKSTAAASILNLMSLTAGPANGSNNNLGGIAGQLLGGKNMGDLFLGVLKSATLEDRLIDRFNLRVVYHKRLYAQARKRLEENTSVMQDRKSGIITYTVTDRDSKRAADISRAYISELNQLMSQLDNSSAHRERVFLEGRLGQVKTELADAEKAFSQYSSKSGAIDITEQGKAMMEAAALLQGQLMAAEAQLEGLRQIYASDNVRVRATEAQVQGLKQQLLKFGGEPGEAAPKQSDGGSETSSLYPTIRQLPLIGVRYADLLRELKIKEAVFEVLTKEHELAKAQEAGEAPSVTVLDPPSTPEARSYPPRLLIVILWTIAAFVLAVFFLLGREHWREMDPNSPPRLLVQDIWRGSHGGNTSGVK